MTFAVLGLAIVCLKVYERVAPRVLGRAARMAPLAPASEAAGKMRAAAATIGSRGSAAADRLLQVVAGAMLAFVVIWVLLFSSFFTQLPGRCPGRLLPEPHHLDPDERRHPGLRTPHVRRVDGAGGAAHPRVRPGRRRLRRLGGAQSLRDRDGGLGDRPLPRLLADRLQDALAHAQLGRALRPGRRLRRGTCVAGAAGALPPRGTRGARDRPRAFPARRRDCWRSATTTTTRTPTSTCPPSGTCSASSTGSAARTRCSGAAGQIGVV